MRGDCGLQGVCWCCRATSIVVDVTAVVLGMVGVTTSRVCELIFGRPKKGGQEGDTDRLVDDTGACTVKLKVTADHVPQFRFDVHARQGECHDKLVGNLFATRSSQQGRLKDGVSVVVSTHHLAHLFCGPLATVERGMQA